MPQLFAASRGLTVSSPAIAVVAGQPALVPLKLEGTEGINQLFDYRLTLQTPDALRIRPGAMSNLELNAFVGLELTCFIELENQGGSLGGVREVSTLITQARLVGEDDRHTTYELTLRPWLYLATLRSDCKVFQNQTPAQTIAEVLARYHYASTTRFVEEYPVRDYCVQYNETDFAFVSRLMQEWGINYHFEHTGGVHRLVLSDNNGGFQATPEDPGLGAGNVWGLGGRPMGGDPYLARLPKTMRLRYYDYQEDRFYQLDTELPQKRIYELFTQKTIDRDMKLGQIIPRYTALMVGIAPQGHIVLWVLKGDGRDQVELATFKAQPMPDMTIERYNSTGHYGSNGGRAFPINADRWKIISQSTALKPETVAKLKSGWLPSADRYLQQRIKYPWRYSMSGNGRLLEFTETQGNQEHFYIAPWMLQQYQNTATMRGVAQTTTMWFNDMQGRRHSVFLPFYTQKPVAGEPDLTPIWQAYEKLFPGRKVEDNDYWPGEQDMATLDIHVSDDLKTFTATLIKGDQRIPLPIGKTQFFDLEPFAHWPGQATPPADVIKRFQGGPDVAVK